LNGRTINASLEASKKKFGMSEGMVLAAGDGDIFDSTAWGAAGTRGTRTGHTNGADFRPAP
jgi:tRNA-binding EMAP/Myf-like protein